MARSGAIFGGEHSAHYYFKDFWNADTGMLAALHVLAALGGQDGPLSALVARYDRYTGSGEINSTVADQAARLAAVRAAYTGRADVAVPRVEPSLVRQHVLVMEYMPGTRIDRLQHLVASGRLDLERIPLVGRPLADLHRAMDEAAEPGAPLVVVRP